MGPQAVQFHEAALVQKDLDAFPGQQLAFFVLPANAHLAAAELRAAVQLFQSEKPILYSHQRPLLAAFRWFMTGSAP